MKNKKYNINKNNILLLICIISLAIFNTVKLVNIQDLDILWHAKLGEEILKNGKISLQDNFSWQQNLIWIQHEWLYDVIIYLVIRYTELRGFIWLSIIIIMALVLIGYKNSNPKSKSLYLIFAFIMLLLLPRNNFNRPAEFSTWIIMLIIWIYQNEKIKHKNIMYFLNGLVLANFHGGTTMIACVVYGVLWGCEFITINKDNIRHILKKSMGLILLFAGSLINPTGIELYTTSIKLHSVKSTKLIQEWQPYQVTYITGILFLSIILCFGYQLHKRGMEIKLLQHIAICCVFLILGLVSKKALILFQYVMFVFGYQYLELTIKDLLPKVWKLLGLLKVNAIPVCIILFGCGVDNLYIETDFTTFMEQSTSQLVLDTLKTENIEEIRILHDYSEGNYLIWENIPCFIDSRQMPFCSELGKNTSIDDLFSVLGDYGEIPTLEEMETFLKKYDFTHIWITEGMEFVRLYLESESNTEYGMILEDIDKEQSLWRIKYEK